MINDDHSTVWLHINRDGVLERCAICPPNSRYRPQDNVSPTATHVPTGRGHKAILDPGYHNMMPASFKPTTRCTPIKFIPATYVDNNSEHLLNPYGPRTPSPTSTPTPARSAQQPKVTLKTGCGKTSNEDLKEDHDMSWAMGLDQPPKLSRPNSLQFSVLTDDLAETEEYESMDTDVDAASSISISSTKYKQPSSKTKRLNNKPKETDEQRITRLTQEINAARSERIKIAPIRRICTQPTTVELQIIAEEVAVETVFDTYDVNNFRQMRELIRRKAAKKNLHITVKHIAEIITTVIDEHMIMVALTAQWRDDESLKRKLRDLERMSNGMFQAKYSDSLRDRLKSFYANISDSVAFWRATKLPNVLPNGKNPQGF
jgi:hypothetical protein